MKRVSLYLIVSAVLAADAGILALTHHNPLIAAVLGGLAVLSTVAHGFFVGTQITIPSGLFSFLEKFYGALIGITAASSVIVAWVSSLHNGQLSTDAAVVLEAAALISSILVQVLKPQLARAAGRFVAHG